MPRNPSTVPSVADSSYQRNMTQRDIDPVRAGLQAWIRATLAASAAAEVVGAEVPTGNGASSDTVMFSATGIGGDETERRLVARMAPTADAVQVFAGYDFPAEARVIALARGAGVPAPNVLGVDTTGSYTGAAFLVMDRVDGQVPPDYPPYAAGSWLSDGTPEQIDRLETTTVEAIAALSRVPTTSQNLAVLAGRYGPQGPGIAGDLERWARYHYSWAARDVRVPLMDRAYALLRENLPRHPGPLVFSWGDARLGNIIYQDFAPAALLDWEVPGFVPPEVDLGYLVFMHRFLEDRIRQAGGTGMPGFMEADRVAARYESAAGYSPRDRAFYDLYASVRFTSMAIPVALRKVARGLMPPPEHPDGLIPHRELLAEVVEDFARTTGR